MGLLNEIQQGIAQRLATITVANGYSVDVVNVYYDVIPMGLELEEFELPAIFLLTNRNKIERKVGCNENTIIFELQLIHLANEPDSTMFNFVGDVYRAIYANSPTADVVTEYRTIHNSIYDIKSNGPEFDLNMIEANRFAILDLQVNFRGRYINL